jgi:hypothetical protein
MKKSNDSLTPWNPARGADSAAFAREAALEAPVDNTN